MTPNPFKVQNTCQRTCAHMKRYKSNSQFTNTRHIHPHTPPLTHTHTHSTSRVNLVTLAGEVFRSDGEIVAKLSTRAKVIVHQSQGSCPKCNEAELQAMKVSSRAKVIVHKAMKQNCSQIHKAMKVSTRAKVAVYKAMKQNCSQTHKAMSHNCNES